MYIKGSHEGDLEDCELSWWNYKANDPCKECGHHRHHGGPE